jgi:hypothetical protein
MSGDSFIKEFALHRM